MQAHRTTYSSVLDIDKGLKDGKVLKAGHRGREELSFSAAIQPCILLKSHSLVSPVSLRGPHTKLNSSNTSVKATTWEEIDYSSAVAPCQLLPIPAVHPKQWLSVRIRTSTSSSRDSISNTVFPPR